MFHVGKEVNKQEAKYSKKQSMGERIVIGALFVQKTFKNHTLNLQFGSTELVFRYLHTKAAGVFIFDT